jgi:hypothetical protein
MNMLNPRNGGRDSARHRGIPGWVKAFAIVGGVLLLILIVLHVTGHGFGGHSLHGVH